MGMYHVSVRAVLCVSLISLLATRGYGQEDQSESDKIILHGYFSQAYAKSDNLTVLGIPKGGTFNYRVLALQARYLITDEDQLVVQGRYQQSGVSVLNDAAPQIQWMYYQHDFGVVTMALGKVPVPIGLYNNTREVGTLLPFYRASANYYVPGYETIDGAVLSNATRFGAWRLESTVYGGAFTNLFQAPTSSGPVAVSTRTEYNYGTQLWLETPLSGVRIGTQLVSYQAVDAVTFDTTRHTLVGGSIDATFEHAFARGEYLRYAIPGGGPAGQGLIENDMYGEAGVKLTEQWSINTQVPVSLVRYSGHTSRSTYDRALGVKYAPNSDVAFKLEGHRLTGAFSWEPPLVPNPQGKTTYVIASVSASF